MFFLDAKKSVAPFVVVCCFFFSVSWLSAHSNRCAKDSEALLYDPCSRTKPCSLSFFLLYPIKIVSNCRRSMTEILWEFEISSFKPGCFLIHLMSTFVNSLEIRLWIKMLGWIMLRLFPAILFTQALGKVEACLE